jgi:hypothetical protein
MPGVYTTRGRDVSPPPPLRVAAPSPPTPPRPRCTHYHAPPPVLFSRPRQRPWQGRPPHHLQEWRSPLYSPPTITAPATPHRHPLMSPPDRLAPPRAGPCRARSGAPRVCALVLRPAFLGVPVLCSRPAACRPGAARLPVRRAPAALRRQWSGPHPCVTIPVPCGSGASRTPRGFMRRHPAAAHAIAVPAAPPSCGAAGGEAAVNSG